MTIRWKRVLLWLIIIGSGLVISLPVLADNEDEFWNQIKRGEYDTATNIAAKIGRTKPTYYILAAVCAQHSFRYSESQLYQSIYFQKGSNLKLKSTLQTQEKLNPKEPQILLFIGLVSKNYPQAKLGDPNRRLKTIEPKLNQNAFLQNYRGLDEFEHQNYSLAEKYFCNAFSLKPNYPEPYLNLAALLLKQSQPQKALAVLKTALIKCPSVPDYFYQDLISLISTEIKVRIQPNQGQPRIITAPAIRQTYLTDFQYITYS